MGPDTQDTCKTRQLPLSVAFSKAYELHSKPCQSTADYSQAVELLEHCEQLVQQGGLFSRNEDQEDLSTASMRYLLIPFLKAEALSNMPQQGMAQRLQQVQAAQTCYSQFLQAAGQYGLLGSSCQAAYEAQESGSGKVDPGVARTQKVARFKRSQAVQALIKQLQARQKRADEEAGTEGGPPGGVTGWDDEDERLLWTSQLEAAAIKALDTRALLEQELTLLSNAPSSQQQQHQQQALADERSSSSARQRQQQRQEQEQQAAQQAAMAARLADIAGQLSLTRDKQAIRQQVLRPGHILPTLTVEQQGEIELREAREREARQREAEAAKAAAAAEARSEDEEEAELAKQRAWDDWADDNPRGWGNSKLRPCA